MDTFGQRLRAARNASGFTQDELAEALGVTKSAVSAWENDRETPSFDKLGRIGQILRASLDRLILGGDTPAGPGGVREAAPSYVLTGDALLRDEMRLLRRFRAFPERKRKALLVLLDDMAT